MKQLFRFLNLTADQILKTGLLAFSLFCLVKGCLALWAGAWNLRWIVAIVITGFIFGIIMFLGEYFNIKKPKD